MGPGHGPQGRVYLPSLSMPHTLTEEKSRLLRRMEHTCNARTEAKCLNAMNNAFKDRSRERMGNEMYDFLKNRRLDKAHREDRWVEKTSVHPFHDDQWKEDERIYEA